MLAAGDEPLTGTRPRWRPPPQNFRPAPAAEFERLKDLNRKVARAWAAKERCSKFWEEGSPAPARRFFQDWYGWGSRRRLPPWVAGAQRLKRHRPNRRPYLKHHLTNAVTEGLNAKIQNLKPAARGFRNFENYRTRSLFFCGKLALYPQYSSKKPKDFKVWEDVSKQMPFPPDPRHGTVLRIPGELAAALAETSK